MTTWEIVLIVVSCSWLLVPVGVFILVWAETIVGISGEIRALVLKTEWGAVIARGMDALRQSTQRRPVRACAEFLTRLVYALLSKRLESP